MIGSPPVAHQGSGELLRFRRMKGPSNAPAADRSCETSRSLLAAIARPWAIHLGLAAAIGGLQGCGTWWTSTFGGDGAELRLEGLGSTPVTLDGVLPFGAYTSAEADQSMYFSDVALEDLLRGGVQNGQFLHAQLLWIPLPGRTPVDETAMNVTLRYVVVSDGKVGVYGGGGFAWPAGTPGEGDLTLSIEGSSLSLLAKSEGFTDLLTPARLTGVVTASFDANETRRFRRGISQLVTDGLSTSRWVDGQDRPLRGDQVVALALPAAAVSASTTD